MPEQNNRIAAIDLLRGIVMVLMALDHVRFFFHADAAQYNPLNLAATSPPVFFTRWVTHFCAPVFIFLTGLSACLTVEKRGVAYTSRFLWTRGLWLICLELFVFRLGWDYHYLRPSVELLIIWVIGVSMLFLAVAVRLPWRQVLGAGLVILLTHNLLRQIPVPPGSPFYNAWVFIYRGGPLNLDLPFQVFVLYAFVPYVAMIFLGFGTGRLYLRDFPTERRRAILTGAGLGALAIFLLLRTFNWYGDPAHWSTQKDWLFSILSFINTTKYPTSLLYSLMTLGPACLFLAFSEKARGIVAHFFTTFGRVPMFYFILHLFLAQAMIVLCSALFSDSVGIQKFSLAAVYAAWVVLNALLYPLCRAFGKYKSAHPEKHWLAYV